MTPLAVGPDTPEADAVAAVRAWVDAHVPAEEVVETGEVLGG